MKKLLIIIPLICLFCQNCTQSNQKMKTSENPLLSTFETPHQVPPFDLILEEHYLPAIEAGISEQKAEIEAIINTPEEPAFENTVEALARSGQTLTKVSAVFFNRLSANTNENVQAIAREVAPMTSAHEDDINLNPELFARIKVVNDNKDELGLNTEQTELLDKVYKEFVRGGANLSEEDKAKMREINQELSVLTLTFGENVLAETNAFQLIIENEEDLSGLPESVIAAAGEMATESGNDGKWMFTTQKPSMIPFLQYSDRRELREKLLKAYINRGDNNNENDNKETLQKIVNLRIEKAHLLGYNNHAEFVLDENMAKKPENVYALLKQLWDAALPMAKNEAEALQAMITGEGNDFNLEAWDWWYYTEKLRKEKYDLDEEELRPYFKLENVRDGAFDVATKLFGLTFTERTDLPKPHEDVQAFEVLEADGSHLGILYMDFFPRASKRAGAWMSSFRKQYHKNGKNITPVITTVFNFSKPTGDTPSLLSFEEASTLYHEFGHALHGLLSDCEYRMLSGTSVSRDFVELPSQIMENWAAEPEVMRSYARHYETGEVIPDELIEKIVKSSHFNQGFITVEYLSASFLDMDYHTLSDGLSQDVNAFETSSLNNIGLIPEIVVRYRSTYFSHIFSGGYSSGYYSYIWAAVLDADAFEAFKETSLFDEETARAFRENILERGGTADPMVLYKKFRGKEPSIDPLLKRRGLV